MDRVRAPETPPVVMTIAGSDSGGGAGIQADLKTIENCGGFGTSVITSVTAQHTRGVESTHMLPVEEIQAQYEAVAGDFDVAAIKTGMLGTEPVVRQVHEVLQSTAVPTVIDPVMVAASGDRLLNEDAEAAYRELIEEATLVTPNADEAKVLIGTEIKQPEDAIEAGQELLEVGAEAALVKGGHVPGETITDVLVTPEEVDRFEHPRVETAATHGSGCMLSAAIATKLAAGAELPTAVEEGIDLLGRAVRYGLAVGDGPGAVHHSVGLRNQAAKTPTVDAVRTAVTQLVEHGVSELVPEVGMNVIGATPYAEAIEECAAVDGRIGKTKSGVEPTGDIQFGASSHVARFLLAVREHEPSYRFALNCRFDNTVESALESLDWSVGEYDRTAQPEAVRAAEGNTMQWGAAQAFEGTDSPPVAVFDRGAHGKEPMTKLLAQDGETLVERTLTLLEAIE